MRGTSLAFRPHGSKAGHRRRHSKARPSPVYLFQAVGGRARPRHGRRLEVEYLLDLV